MDTATTLSKNKVKIRLTQERWQHIVSSHKELENAKPSTVLLAIKNPDMILKGDVGELLAVKNFKKDCWLVVPYKEIDLRDGFVLTAYLTTNLKWIFKKEIIWNKES